MRGTGGDCLGRSTGEPSGVMKMFYILNELVVIWHIHICQSPQNCIFKMGNFRDFPGGAVVKNPPANAGDAGSSPGLGRSHMLWSN